MKKLKRTSRSERREGEYQGASYSKIEQMVKLIWTDQAINDLGDVGNYIANNSEKHAKLTVKKLFERPDILKNIPQARRIVPEKNDENIREVIDVNIIESFTK